MNTKDKFKLWEEVGLFRYGPTRGTIFFTPRSTKIWGLVQNFLDSSFAAFGVENVLLPALIPLDLFKKESDNFAGFSPELITITKIGEKKFDKSEHLVLRPTSEPLFSLYFRDHLNSYQDLPIKLNQWTNVWRWEKATNPFLRTTEFHWQEGHAIFKKHENMDFFLKKIFELYRYFFANVIRIPFFSGEKPISERFPGALRTLSLEAVLPDGQFLQLATLHDLGKEFSKIFGVRYRDENNKEETPFQCSWGASTRIIAAILMTHSDENGVALPPAIADVQVELVGLWTKRQEENKKIFDFLLDVVRSLKQFRTGVETPDYRNEFERRLISDESLLKTRTRFRPGATNKTWSRRVNEIFRRGAPLVILVGSKELEERKITVYSRESWFSSRDYLELKIAADSGDAKELVEKLEKRMAKIEDWLSSKNFKQKQRPSIYKREDFEKAKTAITKDPWHTFVYVCDRADCEIESGKLLGASPRLIRKKEASGDCFNCKKETKKTVCYARAY